MSESAENSEKATKPTIAKPSGIKPPTQLQAATPGACSRISRPCSGHHAAKAGPPPADAKSKLPIFYTVLFNSMNLE